MLLRFLVFASLLFLSHGCEDKLTTEGARLRTFHLTSSPSRSLELREKISAQILKPVAQDAFGDVYKLAYSDQDWELVVVEEGEERERYLLPPGPEELWAFLGSEAVYKEAPPALPASNDEFILYFAAPPEDAAGWGVHIWDPKTQTQWTRWEEPLLLRDGGVYGSYARIPLPPSNSYSAAPQGLKSFPEKLGLIIHRGEVKATSQDLYLERPWPSRLLFVGPGQKELACTPDLKPCEKRVLVSGASAHWVGDYEILWRSEAKAAERFVLLGSLSGELPESKELDDIEPYFLGTLLPTEGDSPFLSQFPHLKGMSRFRVNDSLDRSKLVKQELMVAALDRRGRVLELTRLQLGPLLDELFATEEPLGLRPTPSQSHELALWAPTAQDVHVQVYDAAKQPLERLVMRQQRGVWTAPVKAEWVDKRFFYRYWLRVFHPLSGRLETYEVTDPYSLSLSQDSRWSQLVDLTDADLEPEGWRSWSLGRMAPEDMSFYEVHVRDFSSQDRSVPDAARGTYRAFTHHGLKGKASSLGISHLQALQKAGLTHVQLLPIYDFTSVPENPADRLGLGDPFEKLCGEGAKNGTNHICPLTGVSIEEAFQRLPQGSRDREYWMSRLADQDAYNWGYDPFHFFVPEGSYASNAEGAQRILEVREMVQALHELGLKLAVDVVYNHTASSGLSDQSVLDRIVPAYYHRLDPKSGAVERSTCCENTASERKMMEKLMRDSLRHWVDVYKVDAFRFDLMGHHMKENMQRIVETLGGDRYLYGEAWDFGEVMAGARGENASQKNMAGTGLGTFNDRLRDAVRGGGPFDCGLLLQQQGPVQGLGTSTKSEGTLWKARKPQADCAREEDFEQASASEKREFSLLLQDRIRLGLLGTLANVSLQSADGKAVKGSEILYNGQPAGYAKAPREILNYVQNHDNQTLWDIQQLKLPLSLSEAERVKVHVLALALPLLSQGIPYFEMGTDILRSKSLYRDAYNAGDWINAVDWSLESHAWGRALPGHKEDPRQLPYLKKVQEALTAPSKASMQQAKDAFLGLLNLRYSSPLFRLRSLEEIENRIDFLPGTEQIPGFIAMRLSDERCGQQNLDPRWSEILVLFNFRDHTLSLNYSGSWQPHPLWQEGAFFAREEGTLQLPARTLAVLVVPEDENKQLGCRQSRLGWTIP